ncbi:tetratricopeptide repeat protein [Flavobacteriales bacterium]|nr:tetratricopeptide repeat protein [Flavobacteriales bacterium]
MSKNFQHIVYTFCISILFMVGFSSDAYSQNTDLQMAQYYYENADFEKAKLYYEKIYSSNPSTSLYTEYLNTLLELKEFKEAEKITKKKIKEERFGYFFKVKLGEIYEKKGETEEANKYYAELIEDLDEKSNPSEYSMLSNEFERLLKYDLAIETLEKCQSNVPNANYSIAIANLYGMKGDFEKMVDSYLNQIEKRPTDVNRIKQYLPRSINFQEDTDIADMLRIKLLKKVQKNPENNGFYDLLIWMFQQTGDFESAYIQVKAYDKRTKAKGEKIYKFAKLCASNKQFDLAIESYETVIKNENEFNFFSIASKQEILDVLKNKIFSNASYTSNDLLNLKSRYLKTISGIPNISDRAPLVEGLAYLEGFYIHDIDTAEILYRDLLTYPGISIKNKALYKISLADILMLKNQVWDASLLYMQVEKQFKEDVIGSMAKFKNAKLYYYTGDFEWSQNQLDGLKASTSKLISNDAIDLSLLITDNYNMDTTLINMQQFAQADLLIFQNKLVEANQKLDSITNRAPDHTLADEILYKKYEIAYKKQEFKKAKSFLEKIISTYPEDILADNAIYKLAELEENQLNNSKAAFALYEKLLFDYPGSLFVVEARKRYRKYAETLSPQEKTSTGIKKDDTKIDTRF